MPNQSMPISKLLHSTTQPHKYTAPIMVDNIKSIIIKNWRYVYSSDNYLLFKNVNKIHSINIKIIFVYQFIDNHFKIDLF